ncbi:MAG TPA: FecR domain-containing protein [Puia sp.]|nr:FecR domain-containing protein [Puia sp.]
MMKKKLPYLLVTAAILLLAGVYLVYHRMLKRPLWGDPKAFVTVKTGVDEKKNIVLEDGSLVTLNAGTTVRIQKDISYTRAIEIVDGEVFFDVQKNEERPLIIRSQGVTTSTPGASFTISAYKRLNNVSVGVISGKVSIENESSALGELGMNEELVYDKASGSHKKVALEESLTSWR